MIEVGNVVKHNRKFGLRCGSGVYPTAVVVSLEPFVLVSARTDMRWENVKIEEVELVHTGIEAQTKKCMRRLKG